MPVEFESVVTASAAKQIADSLRAAIMDGRLKVDERLPTEEELAQHFKVSRPTVREALKRLAAQHLIRSRRGPTGGNFVASPTPEDAARALANATTLMVAVGDIQLDEMATARLELEGVCCRLAAALNDEALAGPLATLRTELERQRDAALTDEEFCASDVRFHRAVVDAAGNALLSYLMHAVVEALQPVSNMIIYRVREREAIVGFHSRLLQALERHDAAGATAALGDLVAYTRDRYRAALEKRAERAR
ncbi:FadR/GntR family transcriptional regulator [Azospirillum picis]|uniref:DNA-binding FadR family transcriptional regulator n=1 Tax=Azospirillum picis TaxID=488438 RepID=A0ABU0MMF7_9PROT|nr:GntR family transcriptional regulator [Azospirillum picis]MBP2300648.1 DNA-binding FadR family transcriptional regulator [Azospirillum picis]MDQ0534617.1 DNA-binding FadR family transcriptional regulator [Azospirillum picis]